MKFIDELNDKEIMNEYAVYIKALILRVQGDIEGSLDLFKKCNLQNPASVEYLK